MRKLTGLGACISLALLLAGCGEQDRAKIKDTAAKTTAQSKGQLEQARQNAEKTAQDTTRSAQDTVKSTQEAGGKALADAQAKINEAAQKSSQALEEQFTKATEQASVSLQNVKGAPGVLDKVSEVIPKLQETLAGIKDKASAQNALPKLEQLETTVSKLSGQFENLPENAKKTIGSLVQKGTSAIQPLVDRVLALPAVESIRPKIESIMAKLKDLNG